MGEVNLPSRAATYIRVNATAGAPAIVAQKQQVQAFVDAAGWRLGHVFTDTASGLNSSRAGLRACLDAADAGEFEILVVADMRRLSRELSVFIDLMDRLESAGVRVVSVDGLDTSEAVSARIRHGMRRTNRKGEPK
jgi:DNA invertase Pin-like site-specific DNA recombinase